MTELFTVVPPALAFAELAGRLRAIEGTERVATGVACDRVLAEPIVAPETLPAFARSAMDGYAVRSADTFGASEASPAYLKLAGEIATGRVANESLSAGVAMRIHTGAMLPEGADAVVIIENTNLNGVEVEIVRAAAPGENIVSVGEDVRAGRTIFAAGHPFRVQDLGALHALGVTTLTVRRKPVVAILSSGDEVVTPDSRPPIGSVRDVNSVTLTTTVERAGAIAVSHGIVGDEEDALAQRARLALANADALVLSAGSSVSERDMTARAIARLGAPGILVHGIAIKPGKPTILALCDGKPVIGLPGNPVSALVVAWRIVRPIIRVLLGAPVGTDGRDDDYRPLEASLTTSLSSRPGREDYVPTRLHRDERGNFEATPIFGKSNLIFTLVEADGLIEISFDVAGIVAGALVRVVFPW